MAPREGGAAREGEAMNHHSVTAQATENTAESDDLIRLWLRLLSCARRIEDEVQARLQKKFGMSLARFDYLSQLDRAGGGPLTMTELAQLLMVSGGNMTGLTDRLQREGLVERRRDPEDRRIQRITMTPRGQALFGEMADAHRAWIIDMLKLLDHKTADRLMAGLALVKASAEATSEAAAKSQPE